MSLTHRALSAVARRVERPELLATFYSGARELLHEEIAIKAVLGAALRDHATYVDVGTNRGQLLGMALATAPEGRYVAFEPIPQLAAELRRSFPQVDTRELALSAEPGTAEFCHFRTMDGWSGLRRSPEISDERGAPEYIEVSLSTLDIELAELQVVQGGRNVLADKKPFVIFEHVAAAAALYDSPSAALWDVLHELGYEIFTITGDGPCTRSDFAASTGVVNWFARPQGS
jgi:FkbM family methyltransferase